MNLHKSTFLLAHDLMGSRLREAYREYCSLPGMSGPALEGLVSHRLSSLLGYASRMVPFYRDRVAGGECTLDRFPILRKGDIQDHFQKIISLDVREDYNLGKLKLPSGWIMVKTGGSTGKPTTVIHDDVFRDWGRAGRLFSQALCGFPIGTPFFYLWGSMRDITDARESFPKRVMNTLLQAYPLNAFLMDARRMDSYLEVMRRSRIRHLMAYVDAAADLARHVERCGQSGPKLKSIMACAGTVTDDHRELLQRNFGAKIHNKYGSRECADMACECAEGGFHIYGNAVHIEIVDNQGRTVPAGTTGHILVTLLMNRGFPLIRYEIGDMGAISDRHCPCGSPLPLLERVEGRMTEFVTTTDGHPLSPQFIIHTVGVVHAKSNLEKFQFIQTSKNSYRLDVQIEGTAPMPDFTDLRADLLAVLGKDALLDIVRVTRIEASPSGKFIYVRNLVAQT